MATTQPAPLTFAELRDVNESRCARWHWGYPDDWSLSDWAVALAGEVGEVCNVIKKLKRIQDGLSGNKPGETEETLTASLADELADVQCYLDLVAARARINLAAATRSKFNAVSVRNGFPERL